MDKKYEGQIKNEQKDLRVVKVPLSSEANLHDQRTGVKENLSYKMEKKNSSSGGERHKTMRWKHNKETIADINTDNPYKP